MSEGPTTLPPPPPAAQPPHLEMKTPWIDQALQQAHLYLKTIEQASENAISLTKHRLDRILSTSKSHFNQTLDMLDDVKSEYRVYEDVAVGKAKESILVAASHPLLTGGAVLGLGFLGLKRPRLFLYFKGMRLFMSEEAMLAKADARVMELRKTIDHLKAESEKLVKTTSEAEQELKRGRTKLKQTGKQIQSVIGSAYKIERQTGGLKDILKELPRREASRFRTQVTNFASETKRERKALSKEVSKISNYGISV
ncbi:hypothetical protein LIER_07193 [Lithospermum erythrorhizon]|uniref:Uncharacterized protein n=1 Tax=Lithospermum erythrorhizon TaxID=34254 RepID=A0AAV3P7H3_LITER